MRPAGRNPRSRPRMEMGIMAAPPGGADAPDAITAQGGNRMTVEEKVKGIIMEQLGVDAEEVTPEASFINDLGADSLDTVELVMALEEAFKIEISDEDAEKIATVGDAVKYIESHA